jgi:DNA polymerase III delta subunit
MASRASRHPLSIRSYSGADLTSDIVRQLTGDFTYWPLYGGYHSVIVNEADSIPRLAQVRLLDLLERLEEFHAVLVFTSNDDLTGFEDRFLSRVRPQLFTTQGLAEKAIDWLLRIAEAESIPLSKQHARRLVKNAKNNLRTALQALELLGAETGTSSLLNSPLPNLTLPEGPLSACEPLANRRQTANLMLHPQ